MKKLSDLNISFENLKLVADQIGGVEVPEADILFLIGNMKNLREKAHEVEHCCHTSDWNLSYYGKFKELTELNEQIEVEQKRLQEGILRELFRKMHIEESFGDIDLFVSYVSLLNEARRNMSNLSGYIKNKFFNNDTIKQITEIQGVLNVNKSIECASNAKRVYDESIPLQQLLELFGFDINDLFIGGENLDTLEQNLRVIHMYILKKLENRKER